MKLSYSAAYVASGVSFETLQKSVWIAGSRGRSPTDGTMLEALHGTIGRAAATCGKKRREMSNEQFSSDLRSDICMKTPTADDSGAAPT